MHGHFEVEAGWCGVRFRFTWLDPVSGMAQNKKITYGSFGAENVKEKPLGVPETGTAIRTIAPAVKKAFW